MLSTFNSWMLKSQLLCVLQYARIRLCVYVQLVYWYACQCHVQCYNDYGWRHCVSCVLLVSLTWSFCTIINLECGCVVWTATVVCQSVVQSNRCRFWLEVLGDCVWIVVLWRWIIVDGGYCWIQLEMKSLHFFSVCRSYWHASRRSSYELASRQHFMCVLSCGFRVTLRRLVCHWWECVCLILLL